MSSCKHYDWPARRCPFCGCGGPRKPRARDRVEGADLDDRTRALDEGRHDRAAHRREVENDG